MPNRETQSFSWESRVSRRDFLRGALIAGAGALLPACSPSPEPTRRPTPEEINLDIPGLRIQKYKVTFEEISVPFWISRQIQSEVEDNKDWRISSRCGSSLIGNGPIKLFDDWNYDFYFDGERSKFYGNVFPETVYYPPTETDIRRFSNNAGTIDGYIFEWHVDGTNSPKVLCDGKVLYNPYTLILDQIPTSRHGVVIADIPHSSKTVIKDESLSSLPIIALSAGNKLLISYGYFTNYRNQGSYLIDLNNWKVLFQTQIASHEPILNQDYTLLYVNSDCGYNNGYYKEEEIGHLYDTNTGQEKDVIRWPTFQTMHEHFASDSRIMNEHRIEGYSRIMQEHVASDNFSYIARKLEMFQSFSTELGQWGIIVCTREGFFIIYSPDKSLVPTAVDDNGTIYTSDSIFVFKNGTYELAETAEKEPFEVRISKLKR